MGVVHHSTDGRNYVTTISVVNKFGKILENTQTDFKYLLKPKYWKPRDQELHSLRPQEKKELYAHRAEVTQLFEIIRNHNVKLIVVSADCLEAKNLKRDLIGYKEGE